MSIKKANETLAEVLDSQKEPEPEPVVDSPIIDPEIEERLMALSNESPDEEQDTFHFDNILKSIKSPTALASKLLEGIEEDLLNRKTWEDYCRKSFEYLGLSVEELPDVVKEGSKINDTLLLKLLFEYYSIIKTEILISKRSLFKIDEEIISKNMAPPLDEFYDFYVKKILKSYLTDFDRLILYSGFTGTAYKEVYYDHDLKRISAQTLSPFDLIIDSNAISLEDAQMYTKVSYLTKKEIEEKVKNEYFENVKFVETPSELSSAEKKLNQKIGVLPELTRLNKIYECYCYLKKDDIFGDGDLSYLPYKVTINTTVNKIIRIENNFFPGTTTRIKNFIAYRYLPSFKFYGIGIMNLVGSNALASTSILRSSIDIARMASHPSFITQKGIQFEKNSVKLDFGESCEIETGGRDLRECFQKFPIDPPAQSLINLRDQLIQESREWLSALSARLGEANQNQPVGTTLAIMENANKFNSVTLESFYLSFKEEIEAFYDLFRFFLPPTPFEFEPQKSISAQDLMTQCYVKPFVHGDISTKASKIMVAQSVLQLAQNAPQIHNLYEVYKYLYELLDIPNMDQILINPQTQPQPEPPIDPNKVLMQEAQTHQQQVQIDAQEKQQALQIKQQELQIKQQQVQIDAQEKQQELQIKQKELEIKMQKMQNDLEIAMQKIQIDSQRRIGLSDV